MFFEKFFVAYHPEEYQILTSGTDRKIVYWETFDGSQIRELDGSETGGINARFLKKIEFLFNYQQIF